MSNLKFRSIALTIIIISAIVGFFTQQSFHSSKQQPPNKPEYDHKSIIGQHRPDFKLQDLQGEERDISDWAGKVLVVNFWATWCPPCREEIPEFIHLQEQLNDKGVQFLGIALQSAEEVEPFYNETGMNYPTLVGGQDVIRVAKAFGNSLGALPYTIIIDATGKVVFTKRGPLSSEIARKQLNLLL